MIQRVQSVYLLLTTILSVLFLNNDLINFTNTSGEKLTMSLYGINKAVGGVDFLQEEKLIPLTVLLILIPVISFITIFLFKKRKLQLRLTLILIVLIVILILLLAYYSVQVINNFNAVIDTGFSLFFPFLMLLSAILAYRGIKKDEEIVKSYDRLR